MSPRPVMIAALIALASLAVGCSKPAVTPPPPDQAAGPESPAPPPPPPPKCESFAEKCESKADTRAKITGSSLVFTPAPGWIFAQQSSATIAQLSEAGPGIAFLTIDLDAKDIKKEIAAKDAAIVELCKQLGMTALKRKVAWKKPDDKKTVGSLKLDLWQLEESGLRGTKKGPLLVVAGPIEGGKGLVGLGFVPDDDKSQADVAIMKSIESLGAAK